MLEGLDPERQEEIAFQVVVALRDTLGIAKKGNVTYEQAIRVLHDVNPEFYDEVTDAIGVKNITELAKFYEEQAMLIKLTENRDVDATQLITIEIDKIDNAINNKDVKTSITSEALRQTTKRLYQLIAARDSLDGSRKITEHTVLPRDFKSVDRSDLGASLFREEDRFVDYHINGDTYLRIRLLHPDKPEQITGADMIYEQHNIERRQVRFAFLQYKMWLGGVISMGPDSREERQLRRLANTLCKKGFCDPPENLTTDVDYRFPHCCGFLRPTDKMQRQNNKLISSGIHIPVCNALSILQKEMGKIDKRYIRHQTLTHEIFEHLFNKALIGSRWLSEDVIIRLYLESEIITPDDSVIVYAREIFEQKETKGKIKNLKRNR